ncbi:MAG: type I-E CRISPR-associated protein Cas6/Cse3/CasE, partial [Pseudomonadales bacterium]|nr:type I-E CRISPR-associated protein Cas6/Cse3/CasE [Pseudomonadales bacterium]
EFLQVQTKPFAPQLNVGDSCAFSLRANAVVTRKANDHSKKRIRRDIIEAKADDYKQQFSNPADRPTSAMIHQQAGEEWLQKRGEKCGFRVGEVLVSNHQFHEAKKPQDKNIRQFTSLDFQGQIEITEPTLFLEQLFKGKLDAEGKQTASRGLGRSKAFGCGLMLIRKL